MINDTNLILSPELISQESEVYRRQKILFVLVDILFTFNLTTLIAFLHLYNVDPSINDILKFYYPLIWIIISIIYDVFGLIIAYLCCQRGLRVFAWIGIIFLILHCIAFAFILFLPIHTKTRFSNNNNFYTPRYVIFIIFWISISTLLLISVRIAYKLSKLIFNIQYKVEQPMLIEETFLNIFQ